MRFCRWLAMFVFVTTTLTGTLHAGLIFKVYEVGSDVEVRVSGSIDTTGWNLQGVTNSNPFIRYDSIAVGATQMQRIEGSGELATGGANPDYVLSQSLGFVTPISGSATGSTVHFQLTTTPNQWILYLPAGYTSNSLVSGKARYANVSLATMGLTFGGTPWTWYLDGNSSNDSKSITVEAPVPEPGSVAICGVAALAVAFGVRRRAFRRV